MSRAASSGANIVKPRNNIYTVLVVAAIVVEIVGLVYIWMQAIVLHGKPIFST